MANPFAKGWKYLTASLDQKIDENADPKVQIQQATEAAKKQHQQITEHAAAVIGNQRQLEMQLDRLVKQQAQLQDKARQAIQLADSATDPAEQAKYTNTAEIFASQLVACEQQLEDTKAVYSQAQAAAEQAKKQQAESEMRLKEQLAQIDELRAQADQAAMQESTTKAMDTIGQFKEDDSVPTLDEVRAKIERRYANALGAQELTESSMSGRMAEIQQAGTDFKANARLEEIRAELNKGKSGELTSGADADTAAKPEGEAESKPEV
ncbi:PspA/IM30 family protein [Corynebacterium epidermidicanis]|uniref:Phage shock protein A (PspA) family protein n=1 Tax=Corynebacterium epidermidicanis TaxID=1050174 RepID=A0A0G3GSS7_9CORY|nr:PspA/IM30 family protein [Corynebacterium epidermidicanis]AKK04221.1 phage shock protein A (PspA) family protein [Corynebacterium epidermidicanis]